MYAYYSFVFPRAGANYVCVFLYNTINAPADSPIKISREYSNQTGTRTGLFRGSTLFGIGIYTKLCNVT